MILRDRNGNKLMEPIVLDGERVYSLDGTHHLEFITTATLDKGFYIFYDKKEYVVDGINDIHDESMQSEIYAVSSDKYELEKSSISDSRPTTFANAFNAIFANTRWQIGVVHTLKNGPNHFYRTNSWDALLEMCNKYELEFIARYEYDSRGVTNRYIDIYDRIGRDNGKRFIYGADLDRIERIVHSEPIATRFFPYGRGEVLENGEFGLGITIASVNDGLEYLEDHSARSVWGIGPEKLHLDFTDRDYDTDDPAELLELAQADFEKMKEPRVSYEAQVIDLYAMGMEWEEVNLGDEVRIIDRSFVPELFLKGRVISITSNMVDKSQSEIVIGNFIPTFVTLANKADRKLSSLAQIMPALTRAATDFRYNLLAELNKKMNATGAYVIHDPVRGLLVFNTDDEETAGHVVQIGGGFIRLANSKTGGVWNYQTVLDANGIVANAIVTGLLKGGLVHFDLDHGTFLIGQQSNPSLHWDGSNLYIRGDSVDLSLNTQFQSKVSSTQMTEYVSGVTANLASKEYVQSAVDAINRANPNLVSNREDRWEQGNIVSGLLTESAYHIRTKAYFPIRGGPATIKVSELFQAAIVLYDKSYNHLSTSAFATEQTITVPTNAPYFKMVLRRTNTSEAILPMVIESAELKAENASEATQWTPHFNDLSIEDQKEFFHLVIESSNGWSFESDSFTSELRATLYLFNEDVTDRYTDSNITWYRRYSNGPRVAIGAGPTYNMTASEVEKSATYEAEFTIYTNLYYIVTADGDRILTADNERILASGISDAAVLIKASELMARDYHGKLLAAESSINQLADQIELRVKTSTYDADIGGIRNDVGSLEVRSTSVEAAINGSRHTFTATSYEFRDANNREIFSLSKGMANEQNISDRDNVESGQPLRMKIHIGESISSIHEVKLKYVNRPYRAFAKSAEAGGGVRTSAAGGGTTSSTAGAYSASSSEAGIGYVNTSSSKPDYYGDHYHIIYAGSAMHQHGFFVPGHFHYNPDHSHTVDITHSHELIHGIIEFAVQSNAIDVVVNGVVRRTVNAAHGETDLSPWITTNGWHEIELRSSTRKRIEAFLFMKTYIRR